MQLNGLKMSRFQFIHIENNNYPTIFLCQCDIIVYSEDSKYDESIDINPNVKFLPTTVEEHEHRNELVFILGELLLKGGINREVSVKQYTRRITSI